MSDSTDPSDPDTFEDEGERGELDIEAPENDAAEQHLALLQRRDEPLTNRELDEADPADAAEQHRVVDLDEDDYRQ
jgi:hypothetical protein